MAGAVTPAEILNQRAGVPASQATRVEQSRAIAEVQAAFAVAQARPRDAARALAQILESCRMKTVAESAFFKFPRGTSSITGETIHLAVEMARCWGNISYSVVELERNDERGISEMLATATDLETNTTSRTSFIVPHKRDKEGNKPATPLISMRDIYENNANMGARRLRECIFRVLPTWLIEEAKAACYKTLENGSDDRPLPVQFAEAIAAFEQLGVSQARIEAKLGPITSLTLLDLAGLKISYRSITRKEISADDEFPRASLEDTTDAARRVAEQVKQAPAADVSPVAGASDAGEDPRRRVADQIIATVGKLTSSVDISNLRGLRGEDIAALPDEMAAEVEEAFRKALGKIGPAK
ncbi:hypothetical protein [Sphingomonas sp. NFR15]|uniref:hypothetical protein n=1 Tax=Sphingomonas sp. NFR15 TaxID=1566282 RepID=UPI000888125B|nr:hypothetical protein [Sphingomonas sp. NFR15]SDA15147.1 hypothetical protein SAMN03159340_00648 [Sphingomonas sp. NFR15]